MWWCAWGEVDGGGTLDAGEESRLAWEGGVLGMDRGRMVELSESVGDIIGHVYVDDVLVVVPMKGESAKVAASPISRDGVGGG